MHLEAAHDQRYIDVRMQAQRERADQLNRGEITMAESSFRARRRIF